MLDHGLHPPRSREKKRNPWHQHVHRATRPRNYAIDKVWEAVTSRCLGNGRSDGSCKQYGGVKSIICYLCFMQHAWSCYYFLWVLYLCNQTSLLFTLQFVEAMRYKTAVYVFQCRWGHSDFSLYYSLRPHCVLWRKWIPGISAWGCKAGRYVRLII